MRGIQAFRLEASYPPENIVETLIRTKKYPMALTWIKAYKLEHKFDLPNLCSRLLEQGLIETALEWIVHYKLSIPCSLVDAIKELFLRGRIVQAKRFAQALGLNNSLDEAQIVRELLEQGKVMLAARIAKDTPLLCSIIRDDVLDKLIESGNWKEAIEAASLLGVTMESRDIVHRLVQAGRIEEAIECTKHVLRGDEVFIKQLLEELSKSGKPSDILSWAVAFKLTDEVDVTHCFKEMLNRGELDLAEKWLTHAIFFPHYCEVLGMLTRALLKRRQFERVAALWDKYGFDLEKVRHNAARFKAAMSILDQLQRSGELPMEPDVSLLRIFGYVRKVNWIIAPGYYDFYVPPDQRRPEFVGYLVSFQLQPSKHPKKNTWSFSAAAIEPVLKPAGQSSEKEV